MAQWRKVVVSGSNAVLNEVTASGNIVPKADNGSDLGSSTLEWKDLYIDGTANIDSLVADTADINGGTVDGITSLTAGGNLDIGAHDLRASTITADGLTSGRVVFAGTAGVLSDDSDFTFSTDTLTVTKLGAYEQAGSVDFSDETMTNVDIDSGAIDGTPIGANSHQTIKGTTIDATTDFTIGTTVITDDSIVMTPTTDDTATIAASTNGALAITTVDTNAAAANITITADGTFEAIGTTVTLDSGGAINLEPAGGSAILLDGTISIDGGIVTGASSITSTNFVGIIDGALGSVTPAAVIGTTIDASTDFTIDGLVITADTITNDSDLTMDLAGDLAIDVDGGDVTITDNGANIATINATKISGSLASTGSFGRVEAVTLKGDGAGITGLTSAAIDGVAGMVNNYVLTATGATAVTGESNLQFDGTDVVVAGGGKVAFRDNGGEYIYSVSDNVLGLAAGSEIDLTATTIDINGLVDISGNLTVGGDLDVNGTTTTINTANSYIADKFMIMASGSQSDTDGGIIVQNTVGAGYALGYDSGVDRWAFDADLAHNATALGPDAYVGVVEVGTGGGDSQAVPVYGGTTNGVGTIYVDTDDSEIWIYA
jgi:hypothetical protein